jgi:hypothetical protein
MRTLAAIAAVWTALCIGGCSSVGNGQLVQLDAAHAQTLLVPGRTTQADVRQALGDGAVIRFQSGRQTWQYVHRDGLAKGWDDVPYINLIAARIDAPTRELVLLFDANGVLERWSLQTYRMHHDAPAAP